ncbi:MAG: hypothetical protein ACP5H2_08950 [Solirubrobacteraceae bacterium]
MPQVVGASTPAPPQELSAAAPLGGGVPAPLLVREASVEETRDRVVTVPADPCAMLVTTVPPPAVFPGTLER